MSERIYDQREDLYAAGGFARPVAVAGKDGRGAWSVILVVAGAEGTVRRTLTPDEADAVAEDLKRNARLAREPGGFPHG